MKSLPSLSLILSFSLHPRRNLSQTQTLSKSHLADLPNSNLTQTLSNLNDEIAAVELVRPSICQTLIWPKFSLISMMRSPFPVIRENGKWHLRFGGSSNLFFVACFLDQWLGLLMILVWVVIWVSFVFDLYLWSRSVFVFVFDLCFFFFFFFRLCCCDLGFVCVWSLLVIWVCVCVWSPFLFLFFFFFFCLCCCDLGLSYWILGLSSSLLGLIGKNMKN